MTGVVSDRTVESGRTAAVFFGLLFLCSKNDKITISDIGWNMRSEGGTLKNEGSDIEDV